MFFYAILCPGQLQLIVAVCRVMRDVYVYIIDSLFTSYIKINVFTLGVHECFCKSTEAVRCPDHQLIDLQRFLGFLSCVSRGITHSKWRLHQEPLDLLLQMCKTAFHNQISWIFTYLCWVCLVFWQKKQFQDSVQTPEYWDLAFLILRWFVDRIMDEIIVNINREWQRLLAEKIYKTFQL